MLEDEESTNTTESQESMGYYEAGSNSESGEKD